MQSSSLARQWKHADRPLKAAPVRTLQSLYTQQQIDHAIFRERCRADRAGGIFSLVLFRTPRSIGASRSALRLARTVMSRCRGTDEVGWFDEETVCAVLPDTAADGAGRFADNVMAAHREPASRPQSAIYTYPTAWFADGHADAAFDVLDAVAATAPAIRPLTKPLAVEQLFIRPMPAWKRAIDVVGAVFGLALAAPLLVVIAAAIRLTSAGPALFTQQRAGLGGRPFRIYKFRTMCVDAEAKKQALRCRSEQDGPAFKLGNDPRITRIGRLLRKTSLDELPQLWNVLRGDMSLVGPRPLPIDEQKGVEQWQRARLEVTPGLTCIWQVQGRSQVSFAQWVRMDVNYLRRRALLSDLKILVATVPAVLLRKGAR